MIHLSLVLGFLILNYKSHFFRTEKIDFEVLQYPKPAPPQLVMPTLTPSVSLPILEQEIAQSEKQVRGLKPDNEANASVV